MSEITLRDQTRNQLAADRDTSKIFIGGNKYETGTFRNDTGGPLTLVGGELLGRITDGGANNLKVVILESAAADGSQFPVGINKSCTHELADGEEIEVYFCVEGKVAKEKLILAGADTLDTIIANKTIGDRIKSDTAGIILKEGLELNQFDN